MPTGIDAPAQVSEGSTAPVTVSASRSTRLVFSNPRTGDTVERDVDCSGEAQFELPADWVAGDVITVVDADDPLINTLITVAPASV